MERPATAPRSLRPRSSRRRSLLIAGAVVVIVCAIIGLLLSTLFAGATVTVFPRQEQVSVPVTLVAKLNPAGGELGYQTITVTRSASTSIPATGTKQVSKSASGVITIYNSFGTDPQRLIANTRFAAPDGKIYRLHDSVVVPGRDQKRRRHAHSGHCFGHRLRRLAGRLLQQGGDALHDPWL